MTLYVQFTPSGLHLLTQVRAKQGGLGREVSEAPVPAFFCCVVFLPVQLVTLDPVSVIELGSQKPPPNPWRAPLCP